MTISNNLQQVYEVKDKPIAWSFPTFPIMPYGKYRFRMMVGGGKTQFLCFVAECTVIPKPE